MNLDDPLTVDDALALARQLMAEHDLKGWTVVTDRAVRRAGQANSATKTISLSAKLIEVHSAAEVRDTILHEIAHALVGARHGHDAVWRATAIRIGGTGGVKVPADAPTIVAPWTGRCEAGHEFSRHRAPSRVRLCSRCVSGGVPQRQAVIVWLRHGKEVAMPPAFEAELAAVLAGTSLRLYGPGTRVVVSDGSAYEGRKGRILSAGQATYAVRLRGKTVRVALNGVQLR